MASVTVASFDGVDDYLSRADESALDITGDIYVCCHYKPTGTISGILASKTGGAGQVSWVLAVTSNLLSFTVSANGTTSSTALHLSAMTANQWYFVEAYHSDSADTIGIARTLSTDTSLGAFTTAAHSGGIFNSTAAFQVGAGNGASFLTGHMRLLGVMNAVPVTSEREFLFNLGTGREYWELSAGFKSTVVGYWHLSESSGNRSSKKNSLTLTDNGSTSSTTTTVTVNPSFVEYKPAYALRDLVASSDAFQDWVGVSTESAAKASVYVESNTAAIATRPNALIMTDESNMDLTIGGFGRGTLLIDFEASYSSDTEENRTIFENRVGKIMQDVEANAHDSTTGRLFIRTVEKVVPVARSHSAEGVSTMYYGTRYRVNYGVE